MLKINFEKTEDNRKNSMIQREIDNAGRWGFAGEFESLEDALASAKLLEKSREVSIIVTYIETACLYANVSIGTQVEGRVNSIINTLNETADLWKTTI